MAAPLILATKDRTDVLAQIKYRGVVAFARDVDHHFPLLLCMACAKPIEATDTPLNVDDVCQVFHDEGGIDFPVCDVCGKELS